VPEQERAVTALLAEMERRDAELKERESTLRADEASSREHGRRVAERERAVRERERALERQSRAEARRYLLEARAEVEKTIASLRAAADDERAERERAARRGVEQLADRHAAALDAIEKEAVGVAPGAGSSAPASVGEGDLVEVEMLGGRLGRIIEFREGDAIVAVGAVKMTLPRAALKPTLRTIERTAAFSGELPEHDVRTEIDLRGTRVAEIDELLMTSLDAALRADLKSLRIIHGKGTGALRERVAELLGKDVRVRSFRLGAWNEGGAGVTIVEFA
jgi:DNA mismatch repair protein MutS2